jgi:hypothetical protein
MMYKKSDFPLGPSEPPPMSYEETMEKYKDLEDNILHGNATINHESSSEPLESTNHIPSDRSTDHPENSTTTRNLKMSHMKRNDDFIKQAAPGMIKNFLSKALDTAKATGQYGSMAGAGSLLGAAHGYASGEDYNPITNPFVDPNDRVAKAVRGAIMGGGLGVGGTYLARNYKNLLNEVKDVFPKKAPPTAQAPVHPTNINPEEIVGLA